MTVRNQDSEAYMIVLSSPWYVFCEDGAGARAADNLSIFDAAVEEFYDLFRITRIHIRRLDELTAGVLECQMGHL